MHAFWEIVASNALIAGFLAVCVALLGRIWKNPLGLHLLWLLVLVKLITPPIVTVGLPLLPGEPPLALEEDEAVQDATQPTPVEPSKEDEIARAAVGTQHRRVPDEWAAPESPPLPTDVSPPVAERRGTDWLTILAWGWGVGIAVFAGANAWRILRFCRLLRGAEAPPLIVVGTAERIGKRLGLGRVPEIRMLPIRMSPLVWSLGGRPRVLLPAALFERLDAEAREAIIAHELAHVRRKDHWVRLLELVMTTLFWWHPVVWWACRHLRELEEQCCDGLVLGAVPHGARAYATALLDTLEYLSERPVAVPLVATGVKSPVSLARRIKMLKSHAPEKRLTAGRLLLLLAAAAVPMALAFAGEPPKAGDPSRSGDQRSSEPPANRGSGQDPTKGPAASPAAKNSEKDRPSPSATDKETERFLRETWRINVKLDTPSLVPPAVQYVVLDKDPLPGFKAGVEMMNKYNRERLDRAEDQAKREMQRSVAMTVSWDFGFREVTGDRLWLLTSVPAGMSSNRPAGKKWIATKVVQIKGKPVCWCIPVEVKRGEEIKVTLTERNVFDLGSAFDTAMRDAKSEGTPGVSQPIPGGGTKDLSSPSGAEHFDGKSKPAAKAFPDEPAAHAIYSQMIEAMRKANSLSYVSHYKWESKGMTLADCTYQVWLKKPNYFRVETQSALGAKGGILIGDGSTLWIHWSQGRPPSYLEGSKDDEQARLKSYMTKPAPLARHSIGHEVVHLGAGMIMPILDPSTFHGYTDSLQPYLDGVKSAGTEKVGTEECDKIEVSIMKGQRIWHLSLSKKDHLPRKLKQILRLGRDMVMDEDWSSVTLNANIPETMFAWKPPADWKEWRLPNPEERLLKPGTKAPDFELASADGGRIKLSGYRGQVVWFYVWRAG